jgi:serine/threonine-protein kinase
LTDCNSCGQPVDDSLKFCGNCGSAMAAKKETPANKAGLNSLIGQTLLGQYLMESKLGEGGMGTVYLADQPAMDRKAVVKVLHPHLTSDEKWVERFNREAKIASKLPHPNSITLYNYGSTDEGYVYIAMEFVDGPALADVIEEIGAMPLERVLRISSQICGAMQEAHELEIIHRDLKPDNIIISNKGGKDWAKVLDFGIAKMKGQSDDEMQLTATGMVFGTPAYMSPEQFSGEELDNRSDLYSIGVMVFEMLTGKRPFVASTPIGYFKLHLEEPPPAMEGVNPDAKVPAAVEAVVRRALEKDPDKRQPNAGVFAEELEDAITHGRAPRAASSPAKRQRSDNIDLAQDEGPGLELDTAAGSLSFLERLEAGNLSADEIAPTTEPPGAQKKPAPSPDWSPASDSSVSHIVDRPTPEQPAPAKATPDVKPTPPRVSSPSPAAAPKPKGGTAGLELAFDPRSGPGPGAILPATPATALPAAGTAGVPPEPAPTPVKAKAGIGTSGARYSGASSLRTPTGELSGEIQRARLAAQSGRRGKGGGLAILVVLVVAAAGIGYVLQTRGDAGDEGGGKVAVRGMVGGAIAAPDPAPKAPAGGGAGGGGKATAAVPAPPKKPQIPEGMVRVLGGHYKIGEGTKGPNKYRQIQIDPFFMDRDEVTNERYNRCVAGDKCNKSKLAKDGRFNGARQPVVGVRFSDAVAFCKWEEGKRLPTADEWEIAARGEESNEFPWGDEFSRGRANAAGRQDGHPQTAPVGSFMSGNTLLGIRDMAGNAAEYVADSSRTGLVRGGSYQSPREKTASAVVHKLNRRKSDKAIGFRCAKSDV